MIQRATPVSTSPHKNGHECHDGHAAEQCANEPVAPASNLGRADSFEVAPKPHFKIDVTAAS
jgi:hypothetical protein